MGDNLSAETAGAGAKIENLVGAGDHVAIVLDQQQRIAQIAKPLQGIQQAAVVAGVQADRRFVQHIEHAAKAAAHLCRQTDTLHLAAGKRRRGPGERKVIEAHIDKELRAIADFAVDLAGDFAFGGRWFPGCEVRQQLAQRQAADLVHSPPAKLDRGRVVAKPASAADRAIDFVNEMLQAAAEAGRHAAGFFERRIEALVLEAEGGARHNPTRKRGNVFRPSLTLRVMIRFGRRHDIKPLLAGPMHDQPAVLAAELFVRDIDRNAGRVGETCQHPREEPIRRSGP